MSTGTPTFQEDMFTQKQSSTGIDWQARSVNIRKSAKIVGFIPEEYTYEALDEILRLQSQVKELQSQSEWVSVEDYIPELYQTVLVVNSGVVMFAEYKGDCEWYSNDQECRLHKVTHWQSLPQPPSEVSLFWLE